MFTRSQNEITESWSSKKLIVSICCITYNHEQYIAEALDSFLMQETDFPFEIVIHDDASTDKTSEIIKAYEEKYPSLFKPIYQTENQKSKFKSGMNPRFNYPRARGKYIALCDGDDYWTDPLKLQKQVNFMESHPDYTLCFTDRAAIDDEGKPTKKVTMNHLESTLTYKNFPFLAPTLTRLFRREDIKDFPVIFRGGGDMIQSAWLTNFGKFKFMKEQTGVYRIHGGGVYSRLKSTQKIAFDLETNLACLPIIKDSENVRMLKIIMRFILRYRTLHYDKTKLTIYIDEVKRYFKGRLAKRDYRYLLFLCFFWKHAFIHSYKLKNMLLRRMDRMKQPLLNQ